MTLEEAQAVADVVSMTNLPFVSSEMMNAFCRRFPQFEPQWTLTGYVLRLKENT